jgi:LTXXQ motif family protein
MTIIRSQLSLAALGLSAVLAVAFLPVASDAQPGPRQLPGPTSPNAAPNRPAPPDRADPRGFDRRGDQLARRLDFLHAELRITQAQQRLWDDFANAVRQETDQARMRGFRPRDDFRGRDDDRRAAAPSVVQRLERRQQALSDRTERVDHLLGALRPLYAALNDDQKRRADELMFARDQDRFGRGRFTMRDRFNRGFDRPNDGSYYR